MTTHEHDPRAVEALASKLIYNLNAYCHDGRWWLDPEDAARYILDREAEQAERAEGLVKALEDTRYQHKIHGNHGAVEYIDRVLAAYRASTQPEPSLAEAVAGALENLRVTGVQNCMLMPVAQIEALEAALARERSRDGGK